jgi:hypothetical protein
MGGYYRAPPMDRGDGAPVPYCDEDGDDDDDDDDDGSLDYERLLRPCRSMEVRRVPRGCPGRRMCGCGPPDEFRYYVRGREVAYSFEVPGGGALLLLPPRLLDRARPRFRDGKGALCRPPAALAPSRGGVLGREAPGRRPRARVLVRPVLRGARRRGRPQARVHPPPPRRAAPAGA